MAGEGQSYQNRIADLLDDITVGAASVSPTPTDGAIPGQNGAAKPLPLDASPVVSSAASQPTSQPSARDASPAPTSLPSAAPLPVGGIPIASASTPARDEGGSLPPFLRQPPADPEKGSTLPGTALFASAAKSTTPHAEQPPAQPPVPPVDGESASSSTLPLLPTGVGEGAPSAATQAEVPAVPDAAVRTAETTDAAAAEVAATSVEPAPGETTAPVGPPISIKGRSDGLVIEIGKGSWSEILATLDERLQQSASFFRNARVAVDLGARATTEAELKPLADLLKTHGLVLASVRTSTERTFQAALALGFTTTLESADGVPVADAAPASTNTTVGAYFVYRGYLRSGHRLQRKESVLVIGDVNPGAEVSSDGDVLVWGRLRGVVHAGAKGNTRAIVAALDLDAGAARKFTLAYLIRAVTPGVYQQPAVLVEDMYQPWQLGRGAMGTVKIE